MENIECEASEEQKDTFGADLHVIGLRKRREVLWEIGLFRGLLSRAGNRMEEITGP